MTTKLEQAARQIIVDWDSGIHLYEAITALRKALEQPVSQEPVAWWFQPPNKNVRPMFDTQQHGGKWQPLYAAPLALQVTPVTQAVRTKDHCNPLQDLTDDEIYPLYPEGPMCDKDMIDFARAVIHEFRRKNGLI